MGLSFDLYARLGPEISWLTVWVRWLDLVVRNVAKGGSWTFPARAGTTWLRLDQPSKNGRLRCGSDLAPTPESARRRPGKVGFPTELAVIDRDNNSLAARPTSCSLGRMLEGMKSMAASPYGFWTSPITSDLVVANSIRIEQVALDGDAIYWTETQTQKQGRAFVYRSVRTGSRNA